jgi:hypothetical protein
MSSKVLHGLDGLTIHTDSIEPNRLPVFTIRYYMSCDYMYGRDPLWLTTVSVDSWLGQNRQVVLSGSWIEGVRFLPGMRFVPLRWGQVSFVEPEGMLLAYVSDAFIIDRDMTMQVSQFHE